MNVVGVRVRVGMAPGYGNAPAIQETLNLVAKANEATVEVLISSLRRLPSCFFP